MRKVVWERDPGITTREEFELESKITESERIARAMEKLRRKSGHFLAASFVLEATSNYERRK